MPKMANIRHTRLRRLKNRGGLGAHSTSYNTDNLLKDVLAQTDLLLIWMRITNLQRANFCKVQNYSICKTMDNVSISE